MRKTWTFSILLVICLSYTGCMPGNHAEDHAENSMERDTETHEAQMLAPGVISTGQDYCTTMSPDRQTLYFARSNKDTGRDAILASTWEEGQWSEPQKVNFTGPYSDTDPLLSPDGSQLFFMSDRPVEGTEPREDFDIWVSEKTDTGWGAPRNVGAPINTAGTEGFPSVTTEGVLYFFATLEDSYGKADIYRSRWVDGAYTEPENVGPPLNTEAWDGHGYITPDETVLVFYSNKPDGLGGGDLYVSYNRNGTWSEPENLGPAVNTEDHEITPYISPDGAYLFFSRIDGDVQEGQRNIYYIDIKSTPIEL